MLCRLLWCLYNVAPHYILIPRRSRKAISFSFALWRQMTDAYESFTKAASVANVSCWSSVAAACSASYSGNPPFRVRIWWKTAEWRCCHICLAWRSLVLWYRQQTTRVQWSNDNKNDNHNNYYNHFKRKCFQELKLSKNDIYFIGAVYEGNLRRLRYRLLSVSRPPTPSPRPLNHLTYSPPHRPPTHHPCFYKWLKNQQV